jgi:osmotically-inducible protein OsmY
MRLLPRPIAVLPLPGAQTRPAWGVTAIRSHPVRPALGLISGRLIASYAVSLLLAVGLGAPALQAASGETDAPPSIPAAPAREIPDGTITFAVEDALLADQGVFPNDVDVTTSHGIVTLSGAVENLLIRQRVIRIAESLRGVRAVVSLLSVTPVVRPDEDIRKDILIALLQDPATYAYQVAVSVRNGVATLTGNVGSYAEVHLAEQIAKGIIGVRDIRNAITFDTSLKRQDAEISAEVKARLEWDIWLNRDTIAVSVMAGKVTLSGDLGAASDKWLAFDDAWVTGVAGVDITGLSVDPLALDDLHRHLKFAPRSDAEIAKAIQAALRLDPRVKAFAPEVSVDGGEAVLSGTVGNFKAKMAAEQDAVHTVGVDEVRNLIAVRPTDRSSDGDIMARLTVAVMRDPLLSNADVHIAVVHRIATLSGVVDTQLQKDEAAELAARTMGLASVRNRLQVDQEFATISNGRLGSGDSPYMVVDLVSEPHLLSDEQIKRNIDHGFLWSHYVARDDIHVTVSKGVATLTGTVTSWIGWNVVSQAAQHSGALIVANHVEIKKGSWWWP